MYYYYLFYRRYSITGQTANTNCQSKRKVNAWHGVVQIVIGILCIGFNVPFMTEEYHPKFIIFGTIGPGFWCGAMVTLMLLPIIINKYWMNFRVWGQLYSVNT